jgi:hypothetical membrane protein
MNFMTDILHGEWQRRHLRAYLIAMSAIFWGLIFCAWLSFPKDHHFSILTHTFSFLGSFEQKHNPDHWWIFSTAMIFWGAAMLPLVLYIFSRFSAISKAGACAGAVLFALGGIGTIFVGIFPDARGAVIGKYEWTQIHEKAAMTIALGFFFGALCHGILLAKDKWSRRVFAASDSFQYRQVAWPYAVWFSVVGVGLYFQIKWEFVYANMKAAAANTPIGSHWSEALNTIYSFPLWENLVIYTMFLYLVWFTLALPRSEKQTA